MMFIVVAFIDRIKSSHNNAVTKSIVDKVKGQDYPDASKIACKLWLISEYTNHSIHSAQMQLKSTMSTW